MSRGTALAALAGAGLILFLAAGPRFFQRDRVRPQPVEGDTTAAAAVQPDLAARTKGSPDAPIAVYEIADFQCPACRAFWSETLPYLEQEYLATGKMRLTFVNLPLVSIHPNAAAAHELAMCGAEQNRFWPMHDLLYRHQRRWAGLDDPRPALLELADSAGLQPERLKQCLESGTARAAVEREAREVFQQGVQSTPSFVIDRTLLRGAIPIDAWRPILDSIYTEKTGNR